MKLCFISPPEFLREYSSQGDIELCLAHLMGNEKYASYFKERHEAGVYVILDHGVVELGQPVKMSLLIDILKKYKFPEVVAPDVIGDSIETARMLKEFLNLLDKEDIDVVVMGVAQGSNWFDFRDSFKHLACSLDIDVIGLPFTVNFKVPGVIERPSESKSLLHARRRLAISTWINNFYFMNCKGLVPSNYTPIHLLGLHDGIELKYQKEYPFIRSNDSASAFISGYNSWDYNEANGLMRDKWSMDFTIEGSLNKTQKNSIQHNMDVLKEYVKLT